MGPQRGQTVTKAYIEGARWPWAGLAVYRKQTASAFDNLSEPGRPHNELRESNRDVGARQSPPAGVAHRPATAYDYAITMVTK